MIPEDEQIRARQRSRARVMGFLLAAFAVLVFAIAIVKIRVGWAS
jgi:hypothetical protein